MYYTICSIDKIEGRRKDIENNNGAKWDIKNIVTSFVWPSWTSLFVFSKYKNMCFSLGFRVKLTHGTF
jgi:hypothetical protein